MQRKKYDRKETAAVFSLYRNVPRSYCWFWILSETNHRKLIYVIWRRRLVPPVFCFGLFLSSPVQALCLQNLLCQFFSDFPMRTGSGRHKGAEGVQRQNSTCLFSEEPDDPPQTDNLNSYLAMTGSVGVWNKSGRFLEEKCKHSRLCKFILPFFYLEGTEQRSKQRSYTGWWKAVISVLWWFWKATYRLQWADNRGKKKPLWRL